MADVVSAPVRSRMMSKIKGKNTRPEMVIRSGLHARGYRYRLHAPNLPGRPDLVFPKFCAIILINGCFWHMHGCQLFKWPSSRKEFWQAKLERNRKRDIENMEKYKLLGWRVLVVWECALKGTSRLSKTELLDECAEWLLEGKLSGSIPQ